MAVATTTIHLVRADDGFVAVTMRNGTLVPAHTVAAKSVADVRQQVSALMAAFEGGHRPITDPVALAGPGAKDKRVVRPLAERLGRTG